MTDKFSLSVEYMPDYSISSYANKAGIEEQGILYTDNSFDCLKTSTPTACPVVSSQYQRTTMSNSRSSPHSLTYPSDGSPETPLSFLTSCCTSPTPAPLTMVLSNSTSTSTATATATTVASGPGQGQGPAAITSASISASNSTSTSIFSNSSSSSTSSSSSSSSSSSLPLCFSSQLLPCSPTSNASPSPHAHAHRPSFSLVETSLSLPNSFFPEFFQYSKETYEQSTGFSRKKRRCIPSNSPSQLVLEMTNNEWDFQENKSTGHNTETPSTCAISNAELRRQIHIQSEQKRRAQIKDGFEDLRNELPACVNKKMSKVALLHRTVQHIQHLKSMQMAILAELESLMAENEQLRKFRESMLQKQALEKMYQINTL
ncbi:helix-loop-helix DNA-binding domain-containing transcription factor [Phycomyces blakesleeanus]|uniref:Helix-loop-helix DNA-binding domain-containing transcription factor n=2 Tax=Phycomyces blakesleeanus TaxID=4837 RepID=A0A163DB47_PHYB8|nr:helix-loop-helix DNA-binding domain-containing transcription factor [Phycomyces blakesleeanus NRRL 1555(-)]OAD70100.1 helix-loop-helix DNA-binding domain-containing transcription factor [Phycomyces blakesleeanus NRRL 1555(-)]|eukprot:XP_018288140.1 helix-loop-helix DNA-binding domain-containing transcription factor [Phycomyces blakesleeanus NRRL 1555(-)]